MSFGSLGRTRVVDRVLFEIVGKVIATIEPFLQLRMSDVARDDDRSAQCQPSLDRILAQSATDSSHWPIEVNTNNWSTQLFRADLGQVLRGIPLKLFQEHAFRRDLAENLSIGRAGDAYADRAGSTMSGQSDDPNVMAEIFAAELRADAHAARELQDLLLQSEVAESMPRWTALRRQADRGTGTRQASRF